MPLTLEALNRADAAHFAAQLSGLYEHAPWIAEQAARYRPFTTLEAIKQRLQTIVRESGEAAQRALMLGYATESERALAALDALNAPDTADTRRNMAAALEDYRVRFGVPCIVATAGPRGTGVSPADMLALLCRRMRAQGPIAWRENLRQIHRIAELRLNALLGNQPVFGEEILDRADQLALHSDAPDQLTCAYLSPAHRRTATLLLQWMREAGMQAHTDVMGNVVGRYAAVDPAAKTLVTGSHYDTVRNGGRYDGREGVLLPIAVVRHLHARGERLPFHLEIIAFAEEEGMRFRTNYLCSHAVIGQLDPAVFDRTDAEGVTMRQALHDAGLDPEAAGALQALRRDPSQLLGYVEVHIEQGPLLLERDLPVGIVTSIAGNHRYLVELTGVASHAGTTPMDMRHDAAAAAAEIVLAVERRCSEAPGLVGTVGQLEVPNGTINVIPGRCRLSIDIRAPEDAPRDAAVADVLAEIDAICARRGVMHRTERVLKAAAAPCAPWLMQQLAAATERHGVPAFRLPSGAGHDAMVMARITDVAMLFTRCGNGGISHNPLETLTADDADLSARIFLDFLRRFQSPAG